MKILLVDDDADFRALARVLLRRSFPLASVREYDPETEGLPPPQFPWADYDVVLLDHELHAEQTGLDWLRRFGKLPGFPAVIFATGTGDENLAARAMKFGAAEYLSKRDVSAERLGELVSSVLAERSLDPAPESLPPVLVPPAGAAAPVPGFSLRRLLGCGGTADVYLAERLRDGLTVVVKLLREAMAGNVHAIHRFQAEAEVLARIDSPEVVRVYDHGVANGRAYMAMEYLGYGDLCTRIVEGIAVAQARTYAVAIARGLATVHAHGFLHRDVKPGNVMFRYDNSLALTDFGIVKNLALEVGLTSDGSVVGTPAYMSPEQCEGLTVDVRSDLYALGVVLHEMLTGARPFVGESASMLFMQHVNAPVPRLPAPLQAFQPVLDRLMAKQPDQRYPDARSAADAIEALTLAGG